MKGNGVFFLGAICLVLSVMILSIVSGEQDNKALGGDLKILQDYWYKNCTADSGWCSGADINMNGRADSEDYFIIADNFGRNDCDENNSYCGGADINMDGSVTDYNIYSPKGDLGRLFSYWYQNCTAENNYCNGADISGNGRADSEDYFIIAHNWGRSDCAENNSWCDGADITRDGSVNDVDAVNLSEENYVVQPEAQEAVLPVLATYSGGGVSSGCSTDWNCTAWSSCADVTQTRTCVKEKAYCSAIGAKPAESQSCVVMPDVEYEQDSGDSEEELLEGSNSIQDEPAEEVPGFFLRVTGGVIGAENNNLFFALAFVIALAISAVAVNFIAGKKAKTK